MKLLNLSNHLRFKLMINYLTVEATFIHNTTIKISKNPQNHKDLYNKALKYQANQAI